jgi:putative transposase
MSRPNRRDIVDPDNPGIYHCYSRCVQRAYLCGYDQETGEKLDHRKQWIEDRQIFLASIFAMELQGYAILDNHMHHVIRTRPDIASEWSDEEVVRRWLRLHPSRDGRGKGTP